MTRIGLTGRTTVDMTWEMCLKLERLESGLTPTTDAPNRTARVSRYQVYPT